MIYYYHGKTREPKAAYPLASSEGLNGERVTLEEYRKTKYEDLRIRVPIGKKAIIKQAESTHKLKAIYL